MSIEPICVLIVDDDEDDFVLIKDCFDHIKQFDATLHWASSYTEALSKIQSQSYEICFFDYHLDEYTGIDLLKKVTQDNPYLPIIMLTGLDDYDIDIQAMKHGAIDYLVKPQINESVLERAVRYSMDRMRSHLELKRVKDLALDESEKKYEVLFQQSPDAILILDETGCILNGNAAAESLMELTVDEVKGHAVFELGLWFQDAVEWLQGHILESPIPLTPSVELKAGGKERPLYFEAVLGQVNQQASNAGFQLILRDITERKRAEQALRLLNEELEERVHQRTQALKKAQKQMLIQERMAALGQLTATVAHEIRNPLSTVRASIFTIEDTLNAQGNERIFKSLALAEKNILRCDEILNELLDFTRKKGPQLSPVRVDEWLAHIIKEQVPEKEIEIKTDLSTHILASIDPWILKRAIVNTLSNSIEALTSAAEKDPWIKIASSVHKGRIEIVIQDNGPGIPAEFLNKAMEPLFSTKNFGIGLGLSITQKIMMEHDGGIEIHSEAGQGTTVILWLPIHDAAKNENDGKRV